MYEQFIHQFRNRYMYQVIRNPQPILLLKDEILILLLLLPLLCLLWQYQNPVVKEGQEEAVQLKMNYDDASWIWPMPPYRY